MEILKMKEPGIKRSDRFTVCIIEIIVTVCQLSNKKLPEL